MLDLSGATLPDLPGALCAETDPALFFPEQNGERGERASAIATCRTCPARLACLQFALEHHPDGIWGGTTAGQRRRMREQRSAAA